MRKSRFMDEQMVAILREADRVALATAMLIGRNFFATKASETVASRIGS